VSTLKQLVAPGNTVRFTRYFDGQLWYAVNGFEFPVPVSDIGTATFLAEDKAILFMRYIRKHLAMLDEARDDGGSNG
jgi:hypothetical protein